MRKSPKRPNTHSKRAITAVPAKMKKLRKTRAPMMPQKSTSCWYLRWTPKKEKSMRNTKRLSMDSDFSIR